VQTPTNTVDLVSSKHHSSKVATLLSELFFFELALVKIVQCLHLNKGMLEAGIQIKQMQPFLWIFSLTFISSALFKINSESYSTYRSL